jgi:GntR family transcriptional repressor for pyruvate dehydrogenase complex
MKIRAIHKSSAAGKVFETLYEMILSGQARPGERLPSQDEMAVRFGVSRNTLREAIHKLTAMGLLLPAQGVGTVVQPFRPDDFLASLDGQLLQDAPSVREFVEARICVERATVRLAVIRSAREDVKRLKRILEKQRRAVSRGDVAELVSQDVAFHVELAKVSGNRVLLKFLQVTWGMLHEFITEVSGLPGAIEEAVRFHSEITEALAGKDIERAEEKMLRHLMDVVKRIERNINIDLDIESLFGGAIVSLNALRSRKSRRMTGR